MGSAGPGMLVRWGTAVADRMGFEVGGIMGPPLFGAPSDVNANFCATKTVVEASDYAYRLYESEGFVFKQDYVIPLPEKWAGRKRQKFKWMVRPVHSGGGDDKPDG